MQKILTLYPISKVRLLNSSETLRVLVQEIEIPERLSVLKTAVNMTANGEESEFFSALMEYVHDMPKGKSLELYRTADTITESLVPKALILEMVHVLKVGKAEERGFLYDEKKNQFAFNPNAFARHFLNRCHVRLTKDGRLFLYNRNGFFEELSEVNLGKVIRTVMHEGRWDSWKSTYEAEVSKALQRKHQQLMK